jgi:hypothetical protein
MGLNDGDRGSAIHEWDAEKYERWKSDGFRATLEVLTKRELRE